MVAYDYEWHHELIGKNDERGYLVPYRDYQKMAEKVLYIFSHPEESREKARLAREFTLEHYSKERVVALERDAFQKYMSKK